VFFFFFFSPLLPFLLLHMFFYFFSPLPFHSSFPFPFSFRFLFFFFFFFHVILCLYFVAKQARTITSYGENIMYWGPVRGDDERSREKKVKKGKNRYIHNDMKWGKKNKNTQSNLSKLKTHPTPDPTHHRPAQSRLFVFLVRQ